VNNLKVTTKQLKTINIIIDIWNVSCEGSETKLMSR